MDKHLFTMVLCFGVCLAGAFGQAAATAPAAGAAQPGGGKWAAELRARRLDSPYSGEREQAVGALAEMTHSPETAVPLLEYALLDEEAAVRRAALEGLGRMGPKAIPALIDVLRREDRSDHAGALGALKGINPKPPELVDVMIAVLQTRYDQRAAGDVHWHAFQILEEMGPPAARAVPAIIAAGIGYDAKPAGAADALGAIGLPGAGVAIPLLVNADSGRGPFGDTECGRALCMLGLREQSVPVLIRQSREANFSRRAAAVELLLGVGADVEGVAPAVGEALADERMLALLRWSNVVYFQGERAAAAIVPAAAKHLSSESVETRRLAVGLLNRMHTPGKTAVDVLIRALKDPDKEVREQAAETLGEIGEEADKVVPALAAALSDVQGHVYAARALARFGPRAEAALPALAKSLSDTHPLTGSHAIEAIAKIGAYHPAAAEALIRLLRPKRPSARKDGRHFDAPAMMAPPGRRHLRAPGSAADALGRMGPKIVPALRGLLRDEEPMVRLAAAQALSVAGPAAKDAAADLTGLLKDASQPAEVRGAAATALAAIGPEACEAALDALLANFGEKRSSGYERRRARLDPYVDAVSIAGKKAVPRLPALAGSDNAVVRGRAVEALGAAGVVNEEVTRTLIAALADKEGQVTSCAVFSLGELKAAAAAPALLEILNDTDCYSRDDAAWALGRIGPVNKDVLPALKGLAGDMTVRDTAYHGSLKVAAVGAVRRIQWRPGAKPLAHVILQLDAGPLAAAHARAKLERSGPPKSEHLPELLAALREGRFNAMTYAIRAIGELGQEAKSDETVEGLVAAMHRDHPESLVDSEYNEMRQEAAAVLSTYGPDAVAAVEKAYDSLRGWSRCMMVEALAGAGDRGEAFVPLLLKAAQGGDDDPNTQYRAIWALGQLGPAARKAVPGLKRHFAGSGFGLPPSLVAETLLKIGPIDKELVGLILKACDKQYGGDDLPETVAGFGRPVLEPLLAVLGDTADGEVAHKGAVEALGLIRPTPPEVIDRLIEAMNSSDDYGRLIAVRALVNTGVTDEKVVLALGRAAGDHDSWTAEAAAKALAGMGPRAKAAIPLLKRARGRFLEDHDYVETLEAIGPAAVPALIDLLADEDASTRYRAASALGAIGREARAALPKLRKLLEDKDEDVREKAQWALRQVAPVGEETLARLAEMLRSRDGDDQERAAEELVNLGEDAVGALMKLLKDSNGRVREQAAAILGRIGTDAISAEKAIEEATEDRWKKVSAAAWTALEKVRARKRRRPEMVADIGPMPPAVVRALAYCFEEGTDDGRFYAAWALAGIGPTAAGAVERLGKQLNADPDAGVRQGIAAALGRIGVPAKEAMPALEQALKDRSADVRKAAAEAIEAIKAAK